MRINKWYILAGGSATRWNGHLGIKNKCLAKVDGETLLARTERLLYENGVKDVTIILDGWSSKRKAFEGLAKRTKGPFGILLGDCYYTEAIIKDATHRDVEKWQHYYNCLRNPWTGCPWEEGYIHLVPDWQWWQAKMHEFNEKVDNGEIEFVKDFQIDRYLRGYSPHERRWHTLDEHDIFWCDETDDFDYPEDYDHFIARHELNRVGFRADRLSIIIPHYNTPAQLRILLNSLLEQKRDYPETEIIVIDDGSTCDMRFLQNYGDMITPIFQPNRGVASARNVGLMAATGRYITFVDADDMVLPNYVHTVYQTMRNEKCDYAIFPFVAGLGGGIGKPKDELIANNGVWAWAFTWQCIGDKRFDENMNVGEDYTWLQQVITKDKKRYNAPEPIYRYEWNANPDSLSKRYNRGELTKYKEKE